MPPMKLYYRKYGSGPPLIILHGLYGSSDNWISIARSISNRFTVILPDQRNHGASPHSDIHDYESMINDLFELVISLNLDKFFLAGHSMGGKTATKFALTWPEKLMGLLVADISPFAEKSRRTEELFYHHNILNSILSVNLSGLTSRSEVESLLISRLNSEKETGFIMKNLRREPDNSFSWKINADSLLKNLERIMDTIEPQNEEQNEVSGFPVFILRGENSGYFPLKDFTEMRRVFPSAELITIPGAGHWIHSDNPEVVKECLLKFLDDR